MMRLIDADALDNALTELRFNADGELAHWGDRKDWCLHGSEVEKLIADAPTVEPKHGYWITWFENEDVRQAKCSVCGMLFTLGKGREIHYCGNCGAKMDEVEDETN